jgi:hypothetical protein
MERVGLSRSPCAAGPHCCPRWRNRKWENAARQPCVPACCVLENRPGCQDRRVHSNQQCASVSTIRSKKDLRIRQNQNPSQTCGSEKPPLKVSTATAYFPDETGAVPPPTPTRPAGQRHALAGIVHIGREARSRRAPGNPLNIAHMENKSPLCLQSDRTTAVSTRMRAVNASARR